MNPLFFNQRSSALQNDNQAIGSISLRQGIKKKILSITNVQISKIAQKIMRESALQWGNKPYVMNTVQMKKMNLQRHATGAFSQNQLSQYMRTLQFEVKNTSISVSDWQKLHRELWQQMGRVIKNNFSDPSLPFLEQGINFTISTSNSIGNLLKTAADDAGVTVTLDDVPSDYEIHLALDLEELEEQEKIVFILKEKSEGIEFSQNKLITFYD